MGNGQSHEKASKPSGNFVRASVLHELGQFLEKAYDQGVTLEEAYAICGAAYGDWREAHDTRTEAMLQEEIERFRGK